jgi:hypothetical protein
VPGCPAAASTVTVDCASTDCAPTSQAIKYVKVPATAADCAADPAIGSVPDHGRPVAPPPLAVQLATFCAFQLRVNVPPSATLVELAVRLTASTGGASTVTAAWAVAAGTSPHSPRQLIVRVKSPTIAEEKSREPVAVCHPCQGTSAGAPAASQSLA